MSFLFIHQRAAHTLILVLPKLFQFPCMVLFLTGFNYVMYITSFEKMRMGVGTPSVVLMTFCGGVAFPVVGERLGYLPFRRVCGQEKGDQYQSP